MAMKSNWKMVAFVGAAAMICVPAATILIAAMRILELYGGWFIFWFLVAWAIFLHIASYGHRVSKRKLDSEAKANKEFHDRAADLYNNNVSVSLNHQTEITKIKEARRVLTADQRSLDINRQILNDRLVEYREKIEQHNRLQRDNKHTSERLERYAKHLSVIANSLKNDQIDDLYVPSLQDFEL